MEKISSTQERREDSDDWRGLRERSQEDASALIATIEGFEDMNTYEQINALSNVLDRLAGNNENRYVAREISVRRERFVVALHYEERMKQLGVVV